MRVTWYYADDGMINQLDVVVIRAYNVNSVREEEVENILRLYEQRTGDSRLQDTNTVCKLVADSTSAHTHTHTHIYPCAI